MSEFRRAWESFVASTEGVECVDPVSLGASAAMTRFMENRMHAAFSAGWSAGMKHGEAGRGEAQEEAA